MKKSDISVVWDLCGPVSEYAVERRLYMKTRIINLPRRNSAAALYFSATCRNVKNLRNTANFYIRNTMSGIRKSPEERTHNETEVLHFVFTGIHQANEAKDRRYAKKRLAVMQGLSGLARETAIMEALRQERYFPYPTEEEWFLSYEVLDAVFKETGNHDYYALPAQVNQNAIRKTCSAWKSYFRALKDWKAAPWRYRGKPRIPKYILEAEATAWFSSQTARLGPKDVLSFVGTGVTIKAGAVKGRYVKTEVIPWAGTYRIMVTYDDTVKEVPVPKDPKRIVGIDPGLANFLAAANNFGEKPFLIRGGALKAANQWFNKRRARLVSELTRGKDSRHSVKESHALHAITRKRDDFIRDYFYKCAHYICRWASAHKADVIVIGHNEGQKDGIRLGQATQDFVSVPFYRFIRILTCVAAGYGLPVIAREESYTSKASFPDMDDIPTYKEGGASGTYTFSGRRVHRGLYRSRDGILMNADINGAANLIRKEYPDAFKDVQDLSYMWESTDTVGYRDLYKKKPAGTDSRPSNARKPSPVSRCAHRARARKKTELMAAFGVSKQRALPAGQSA